jgi:hypothetical protein
MHIHRLLNPLNYEHEESVLGNEADERASLARAKRLGTLNGLKLVWKGYPLPSDDYLWDWYKVHRATPADAEVEAYMRAYKSAYAAGNGIPVKQAECLGRAHGLSAAWNEYTPQSDDYLRGWYRVNGATATDVEVEAYLSAYKSACVEHGGTLEEQAEVFYAMHERLPSMSAHVIIDDDNEIRDEVQEPLSLAELVSMHLSGLNDEPTLDIRDGLLTLARFESASLEERFAAAVYLYSNDADGFKSAAEEVLKGFISRRNLPPFEDIEEYVRGVLWNYEEFANELVAALPRVRDALKTGTSSRDDVILYEGRLSSAVNNKESQRENKRKRRIDQVYEESDSNNSNKKQRVGQRSVSVRGDNVQLSQEEKSVLSAGRKNGGKAARCGCRLKSEAELKAWYKKQHPNASDEALDAYVKSYIDAYEKSKGTPIEHAKRWGRKNGTNAVRQGLILKNEDELRAYYKDKHPEVNDDAVNAYAKSYRETYDAEKGTPMVQAERAGGYNGSEAARQAFTLKSEADLKAWYKKQHPDASNEAANAYAKSYTDAYNASKKTPIKQVERLGHRNGTLAARLATALKSEAKLKAWYKKQHPDASNEAANAYAKCYIDAYDASKSKEAPMEQAKLLGRQNGTNAARLGLMLKNEAELKAYYKNKHPEVNDDAVTAYAKSYCEAYDAEKGTPVVQAERAGTSNGGKAVRHGFTLKSKADLRASYKKQHPNASDEALDAYAKTYTEAYDASMPQENPIEQAKCSGRKNGTNVARQGQALKSEADLKAWYKKQHPDASDEAANAYAKAYIDSYDASMHQESLVKHAELLGRTNGSAAVRCGCRLKSEDALKTHYKNEHPDANDDDANAYANSYRETYDAEKGTPVVQAERLGHSYGNAAARKGNALKSEAKLKAWYKKKHPDANDDASNAYAKSYIEAYNTVKATPIQTSLK